MVNIFGWHKTNNGDERATRTPSVLLASQPPPSEISAFSSYSESHSTALKNSGGASSTLVEISRDLIADSAAIDLNFVSYSRDERKAAIREQAERYVNTRLGDRGHQTWACDEDDAQLVNIAAKCSKSVYPGQCTPIIPRHSVKHTFSLEPSLGGSIKASALYVTERYSVDRRTVTIIVAIRGSKNIVDWVVNANDGPENASSFINLEVLETLRNKTHDTPLLVHCGFLSSARELVPKIGKHFNSVLTDNYGSVDVIFTGHSAGGAVASLLFGHFLSDAFTQYDLLNSENVRMSCITFGAPPSYSRDVTPLFRSIPAGIVGKGMMLAMINDGDPIPRTDDNYIRVLLSLLQRDDQKGRNTTRGGTKRLQDLALHSLGDLVVLRDVNADSDADEHEDFRVNVVGKSDLERLLYANFFLHAMDEYLHGARKIAEDESNGKGGWAQSGIAGLGRVRLGYF